MNKKNITITVALVVVLALGFLLYPKHKEVVPGGTPAEALEKSTRNDTPSDIDSNLNQIDVNASSSEEFKAMDAEIQSI